MNTMYCTHCVTNSNSPVIDPLSEGLVTPPLGAEKLSPRFNFFDNMLSRIT